MDGGISSSILDTTGTAADAAVTSAATKTMSGGALATAAGWASSSDKIAVLGFGLTVLGFIINFIFQFRRDRREQELQTIKLKLLQEKDDE